MSYHVELMPEALKSFDALDKMVAQRVLRKLDWLADNFEDTSPESLAGELKGLFKLRIGDYRAIYSVKEKRIIIHLIGHRGDIYKR